MKNIDLRRDYASQFPRCELCPTINKLVGFRCNGERGVEAHHVVGGTGGRWDVVPNLIMVCRPVHDWGHKHPREFRIACLAVKLAKNEFDRDVMKQVSGVFMDGWLANVMEQDDLLEGFCLLASNTLATMKGSDL